MPVKIATLQSETLAERIEKFRHTIARDDGWTTAEVAEHLGAHRTRVAEVINGRKWGIYRKVPGIRNYTWLLVHPKTLAKHHADKNPK